MSKHYDYVGTNSLETAIAEQMSVLCGMKLLNRNRKNHDRIEALVYKMLQSCTSEVQMENALHGVKVGNETIEEMLARKGYLA